MENLKDEARKLSKNFDSIKKNVDISAMQNKLKEFEANSTDINLWKDQDKAKALMQKLSILRDEIESYHDLEEGITIVKQLADSGAEDESLAKEIEKLRSMLDEYILNSFLSEKYDKGNAIVSIHAGQGGVEAMDWTSMLYRMYLRYAEKRGWHTYLIDISEGEEAGIKSVTFKVEGKYAYGYLKNEAGTHRLVRQSPFNADNLRQTSFALVEVLPEFEDIDEPEVNISDVDLQWQFFRSSTQGGQNVQKVSTAVRVKHLPTGITVTSQTQRYQEQNRKIALNLLRAKLWLVMQEAQIREVKEIKGTYRPASWGNQIRSYVLHPYKMVKDLRTKVESGEPDSVLNGDLDQFVKAELSLLGKK